MMQKLQIKIAQKMARVQGSLLVCAWFAVAAQVMAREKPLPRFRVLNSAVCAGPCCAVCREPRFKVGVTVATTNPREPCRERRCAGGPAASGANGSGELPAPGGSAARLPKRLPELPPHGKLPVALGYFRLLRELCLDAVFRSLRAGWKEPLGAVPMDAILNCSPEDLEDYYNLLGCDELSTVEQILAEYKIKALECHPDKHPGNPKAVEDFQKLQQAKETLTNEESRARYDLWRRSRVTIPFQQWEALGSSLRTSMHWAVQSKKEQMLEAPDFGNTNNITKEMWTHQTGNSGGGLLEGSREQEDVAIPDVKPQSSKNPDSPRFSEGNYWHLRFRWAGDAPSDLLRKFRNYEI